MRFWLQNIRKQKGLSQGEASRLLGITHAYYNYIESGKRNPSGTVALKIANEFGFDMSLFYQENDQQEMNKTALQ